MKKLHQNPALNKMLREAIGALEMAKSEIARAAVRESILIGEVAALKQQLVALSPAPYGGVLSVEVQP